jgi:hypothetical protein
VKLGYARRAAEPHAKRKGLYYPKG